MKSSNETEMSDETIDLFHATSIKHMDKILTEGLIPRGKKLGNWYTNVSGRRDMVYLSNNDKISLHFHGYRNALVTNSDSFVVFKTTVDTDNLFPDENYVDVLIKQSNVNTSYSEREHSKSRIFDFRNEWKKSLEVTNIASHLGSISPDRIEVVAVEPIETSFFYREDLTGIPDTDVKLITFDLMLNSNNQILADPLYTKPENPKDIPWFKFILPSIPETLKLKRLELGKKHI